MVPALATPLVYDASGCFLAVRNDAMVEISGDWHLDCDATSVLIKARVTAAIPDPKAIKKLSVTRSGSKPGRRWPPSTGRHGHRHSIPRRRAACQQARRRR